MKRAICLALCLWLCMPPLAISSNLIDPTRPNGSAASLEADKGWQLTATRITAQRRIAVINGIDVVEGGRIGAARVLRIRHAEVDLEAHGKPVTLHLLPAAMKQTR